MAYQRVQLMKKNKGDAMYEGIKGNEFSYYGRFSEAVGSSTAGSGGWLAATYDENGKATSTVENAWGYKTGLYGGDFTLVGNSVQPFLLRGGNWGNGTIAGVFASYGHGGGVDYTGRFPSSGCVVVALLDFFTYLFF